MIVRSLIIGIVLAGSFASGAACMNEGPTQRVEPMGAIRAGHGEPTFSDRYGVSLRLPMAEADFVALVRQIPLPINIAGVPGTDRPTLMRPVHNRGFDMSVVSHGYVIDGGYNAALGRNELYQAYVSGGQVVYLENAYQYRP